MKKLIIAAIVVFVIIAFTPAVYFYSKYQQTKALLARNPLILETEAKSIIDKVSKLIDLPQDETPTLATVTDVDKLKGQPFFAKAKNGDKLLLYNNSKKAILYDPVANKIIEVGPLIPPTITPANQQLASTESARVSEDQNQPVEKKLSVILYNGTNITGLTKKVEDMLQKEAPDTQVVDRDNAQKRDYTKTLVIDLTGNNKEEAEELTKVLDAEVSTLPAGETKPENAGLLIIVGTDKS